MIALTELRAKMIEQENEYLTFAGHIKADIMSPGPKDSKENQRQREAIYQEYMGRVYGLRNLAWAIGIDLNDHRAD